MGWMICSIIIVLLVAADQLIKYLITLHLQPVGQIEVIENFFYLQYLENRGMAFGLLQDHRWIFIVMTILGCTAMFVFLVRYKKHTFWSYTALTLVIAGGIGNLIDRIFLGYVIDYIYFTFFGYVFNFADCCVTVGAVLMIIAVFASGEKKEGKKQVVLDKSKTVEEP